MLLPELPSKKDEFFAPQFGYKDIKVKTQKYSDKPTPIKAEQNAALGFIANHTDKKHQKEYAKKGGKRLIHFLVRLVCQ